MECLRNEFTLVHSKPRIPCLGGIRRQRHKPPETQVATVQKGGTVPSAADTATDRGGKENLSTVSLVVLSGVEDRLALTLLTRLRQYSTLATFCRVICLTSIAVRSSTFSHFLNKHCAILPEASCTLAWASMSWLRSAEDPTMRIAPCSSEHVMQHYTIITALARRG